MSKQKNLKERVCAYLDGYSKRFREIGMAIHARPELGNEERFASELLSGELKALGFEVEYPYSGLATAFRAEAGPPGAKKVAFLAEYDALPEIGHACGHNLSGIASVAAGAALKSILGDLPGRAVVLGTPDEEGAGGKIELIEAGAFRDISWAMMVHCGSRTILESQYKAARSFAFIYRGKSAHAVTSPEKGVNALDALIQFYMQLKTFRLTFRKDAHAPMIITHGGVRANVIPDYARGEISARAGDGEYLDYMVGRIRTLAQSAAEKMCAKVEIQEIDRYYREMKNDPEMVCFYRENLEILGVPYEAEPNAKCGSTDIGNVSQLIPAIHPSMAITDDCDMAGHTVEFARASGTALGAERMVTAAKAMAMTAVDLLATDQG